MADQNYNQSLGLGTQKFNAGGTPDRGPMLTDYDLSLIAIRESRRSNHFSQLAKYTKMKRGHGDTYKKERKFPILHANNINEQGVDASGLKLVNGKWYSYDAAGARTEHATEAAAKAQAAADGTGRYMSGEGNLYGSSKDFFRQVGAIPTLREEGGVVNSVGSKRTILTAKIKPFSLSETFSQQELELDGDTKLKAELTMELGRLHGEVREMLIRNDLITQGLTNAVYCGTATSLDTINELCVVDYDTLRKFQSKLDKLRVPMDSKILTGDVKIGTKIINAARYLVIPQELERTIEDIKLDGERVFMPVASYIGNNAVRVNDRDTDLNVATGEIGAIGKFRFISDLDMPIFTGAGEDSTDGADNDGDGTEDSGAGLSVTDGHYDAAPILSIGAGCFEVLGLDGVDAKVRYAAPMIIPNVDNTGETGVVSVRWYYGMLFNKPEQVNCLVTAMKESSF